MARPSSNDPIEPMDLANMRENGVGSLDAAGNAATGRLLTRMSRGWSARSAG
jgi:hypothetical protein